MSLSFLSHRLAALIGGVAVAAALCGPALAADKLTVMLDWFVNPNHGPLVIAQQIGAYKRAGLDVTLVQPADPTVPPRLVAARHGDIALDYQAGLYLQVRNGLPLARIGALIDKPLDSLATLQGFGVTKVADLKGKRIGYNDVVGPAGLAFVDTMLSTAHLSLKDVTLVNVGAALSTALLAHRVDAVGVDRNFEPFEMIDKGAKPILFNYEAYGAPSTENLIMVINRDTSSDPRYPRFLAALKEATAYIKAHPQDAWGLFIKAYPSANNKLNHDAWMVTVPMFADNPAALDQAKYVRVGDYLVAKKVIPSAPPPASYLVQLKR